MCQAIVVAEKTEWVGLVSPEVKPAEADRYWGYAKTDELEVNIHPYIAHVKEKHSKASSHQTEGKDTR